MPIHAPALGKGRSRISRAPRSKPRHNPENIHNGPPSISAILRVAHDRLELQGRTSLMTDLEVLLTMARDYTFGFDFDGSQTPNDSPRSYAIASLYAMWLALGLWGAVNSRQFESGEQEWQFAQWLANKLLTNWRDDQEPLNRYGLLPIVSVYKWNLTTKNLENAKYIWRTNEKDYGPGVMNAITGAYVFDGDHAVGTLKELLNYLDKHGEKRLDHRVGEYLTTLQEGEAFNHRTDMADDRLIRQFIAENYEE